MNRIRRSGPLAVATVAAMALFAPAFAADDHGHAPAHADAERVAPDEAVRMLADGNARFVAGASARPHLGQGRLCDTFANGQHPYAAVLACADSRVPVEHVLDAGIGDLFVVRVAGNVADVDEIGTLEHGVEHLGINAVLVLGHTKCGAVTAVVDRAHVTKNVEKLVDNIAPAADAARKSFPQLSGARLVHQAIRLNVRQSIDDLLANSDVVRERVKDGRLKIVGGVYDLHSGEIDWLDTSVATTSADAPKTARTPAGERAPAAKREARADAKAEAKPAPSGHADAPQKSAGHGHDDDHHSDASKAKAAATPTAAATTPEKKDNFLVLGGMLAGSSVVTGLVLHFVGGTRRTTAAPAAH